MCIVNGDKTPLIQRGSFIDDDEERIFGERLVKKQRTSFILGKSSHWKAGEPDDMMKFPLDVTDLFLTNYNGYPNFPFDRHEFIYSFEMVDFDLNGINYRFDFY